MIALLKKDWRLYRVPLIAMLVMSIGVIVLSFLSQWMVLRRADTPFDARMVRDMLGMVSALGLVMLVVTAGTFGASAFAGERRERWSDFLAMMPVSRVRIVLAKLSIAFFVLSAGFAFWACLWLIAAVPGRGGGDSPLILLGFFSGMVMTFSVAWAISSFGRSPAIAAGIAIGLTVAVYVFALTYFDGTPAHRINAKLYTHYALITAVGVAVIAVSSILYIRRVAP